LESTGVPMISFIDTYELEQWPGTIPDLPEELLFFVSPK